MLVYGLQRQQCEKHFRRIHPSLNVVVSRSPFLPLFPRTQFLGIAPLQNLAKKNERTFIFHFFIIIITDPEETNSKAAEKEPVLHSHSLTQSSRDPTVGARPEARRENCIVCSVVVPLHYLLFALLRIPFTNIFVPSASNRPSSRRAAAAAPHNIYTKGFRYRRENQQKGAKILPQLNSTTTRTHSCSNRTRKQRGLWW